MATHVPLDPEALLHFCDPATLGFDTTDALTSPDEKRALKSGDLRIDSFDRALGFASALPLGPAPIPLSCRVVLFGEPMLDYLLEEHDPEFGDLFGVAADFESDTARSADNVRQYTAQIADLERRDGLRDGRQCRGAWSNSRRAWPATANACRPTSGAWPRSCLKPIAARWRPALPACAHSARSYSHIYD
jgi:hypothetical protein